MITNRQREKKEIGQTCSASARTVYWTVEGRESRPNFLPFSDELKASRGDERKIWWSVCPLIWQHRIIPDDGKVKKWGESHFHSTLPIEARWQHGGCNRFICRTSSTPIMCSDVKQHEGREFTCHSATHWSANELMQLFFHFAPPVDLHMNTMHKCFVVVHQNFNMGTTQSTHHVKYEFYRSFVTPASTHSSTRLGFSVQGKIRNSMSTRTCKMSTHAGKSYSLDEYIH